MGICRPYLTLLPCDAAQREYPLREVFNALPWLVRSGAPWRLLPHDFPPWYMVCQQTQRWFRAGCVEAMAQDLRVLLRLASGREAVPTATIFDLVFGRIGRCKRKQLIHERHEKMAVLSLPLVGIVEILSTIPDTPR